MVTLVLPVAQRYHNSSKPSKLGMKWLFKTIHGLLKFAHFIPFISGTIIRWNFHVHFFLQASMQEDILTSNWCISQPKCAVKERIILTVFIFVTGAKVLIIDAIGLSVPFCNQPYLILIQYAIRLILNCVYPPTTHCLICWWCKPTKVHKKMTKDANYEGLSHQSKEDLISRRNGHVLLKYLEKCCK